MNRVSVSVLMMSTFLSASADYNHSLHERPESGSAQLCHAHLKGHRTQRKPPWLVCKEQLEVQLILYMIHTELAVKRYHYLLFIIISVGREIDYIEFLKSIRRILFPAQNAEAVDMELPAAAFDREPCREEMST